MEDDFGDFADFQAAPLVSSQHPTPSSSQPVEAPLPSLVPPSASVASSIEFANDDFFEADFSDFQSADPVAAPSSIVPSEPSQVQHAPIPLIEEVDFFAVPQPEIPSPLAPQPSAINLNSSLIAADDYFGDFSSVSEQSISSSLSSPFPPQPPIIVAPSAPPSSVVPPASSSAASAASPIEDFFSSSSSPPLASASRSFISAAGSCSGASESSFERPDSEFADEFQLNSNDNAQPSEDAEGDMMEKLGEEEREAERKLRRGVPSRTRLRYRQEHQNQARLTAEFLPSDYFTPPQASIGAPSSVGGDFGDNEEEEEERRQEESEEAVGRSGRSSAAILGSGEQSNLEVDNKEQSKKEEQKQEEAENEAGAAEEEQKHEEQEEEEEEEGSSSLKHDDSDFLSSVKADEEFSELSSFREDIEVERKSVSRFDEELEGEGEGEGRGDSSGRHSPMSVSSHATLGGESQYQEEEEGEDEAEGQEEGQQQGSSRPPRSHTISFHSSSSSSSSSASASASASSSTTNSVSASPLSSSPSTFSSHALFPESLRLSAHSPDVSSLSRGTSVQGEVSEEEEYQHDVDDFGAFEEASSIKEESEVPTSSSLFAASSLQPAAAAVAQHGLLFDTPTLGVMESEAPPSLQPVHSFCEDDFGAFGQSEQKEEIIELDVLLDPPAPFPAEPVQSLLPSSEVDGEDVFVRQENVSLTVVEQDLLVVEPVSASNVASVEFEDFGAFEEAKFDSEPDVISSASAAAAAGVISQLPSPIVEQHLLAVQLVSSSTLIVDAGPESLDFDDFGAFEEAKFDSEQVAPGSSIQPQIPPLPSASSSIHVLEEQSEIIEHHSLEVEAVSASTPPNIGAGLQQPVVEFDDFGAFEEAKFESTAILSSSSSSSAIAAVVHSPEASSLPFSAVADIVNSIPVNEEDDFGDFSSPVATVQDTIPASIVEQLPEDDFGDFEAPVAIEPQPVATVEEGLPAVPQINHDEDDEFGDFGSFEEAKFEEPSAPARVAVAAAVEEDIKQPEVEAEVEDDEFGDFEQPAPAAEAPLPQAPEVQQQHQQPMAVSEEETKPSTALLLSQALLNRDEKTARDLTMGVVTSIFGSNPRLPSQTEAEEILSSLSSATFDEEQLPFASVSPASETVYEGSELDQSFLALLGLQRNPLPKPSRAGGLHIPPPVFIPPPAVSSSDTFSSSPAFISPVSSAPIQPSPSPSPLSTPASSETIEFAVDFPDVQQPVSASKPAPPSSAVLPPPSAAASATRPISIPSPSSSSVLSPIPAIPPQTTVPSIPSPAKSKPQPQAQAPPKAPLAPLPSSVLSPTSRPQPQKTPQQEASDRLNDLLSSLPDLSFMSSTTLVLPPRRK